MPVRSESRTENRQRLMEIVEVVRRHEIVKEGMTPKKLCDIIEELGPTFIKLGQILSMRSDILPKEYCEALKKLRSSVAPMPYSQVVSIVERSYGRPMSEVFSSFDEHALGSASIAQAHAAVLCSGESVVVKVQREGIHDIMSRDIMLLKQACKLLKYAPVSGLVDFNQVLDEMWIVAQEEMNFQTEAANLERFHALNQDVAFVASPLLYREYTTTHVLVMERIDGVSIDNHETLLAEGYDLSEIGAKLADNYVRQIMTDGFFHADPHPGNIRIRDGKIVWLDMGMMGTLTERQRKLIGQAITGVARGDINLCRDAVMGLGEFKEKADKRQLYRDIEDLLDKYGSAELGSMDLAKVFEDLTDVMKRNGIAMPGSLTMRARATGSGGDFGRTERQRKVVSQLFDKCRDLSLFELIGVYNQVSSGMKMSLSAVDILSVLSQGYGLMTSDADFVEFRIPQDGTYSYSSIGSSSVLDVRWKTNKARFHELLDNE